MNRQKDKAANLRVVPALEATLISLPGGRIQEFQGNTGEFVLLSGAHGVGKTLFFRSVLRVEDCRLSLLQGGRFPEVEAEIKHLWRPGADVAELSLRLPVENFALSPSFHHSVKVGDIFPFESELRRVFAEKAKITCSCNQPSVSRQSLSEQIKEILQRRAEFFSGDRLIVTLRSLREPGFFLSLMRASGFRKGIVNGVIVNLDSAESDSAHEVVTWRSSVAGVSADELLREFARARDIAEGEVVVYSERDAALECLKLLDAKPRCRSCGSVFLDPRLVFSERQLSGEDLGASRLEAYLYEGRSLNQWLALPFDRLIMELLSFEFVPQIFQDLLRRIAEHFAGHFTESSRQFSVLEPLAKLDGKSRLILRLMALLFARPYGRAFVFDGIFDEEQLSGQTACLAAELLREIAALGNLVMSSHVPSLSLTDKIEYDGVLSLADRVYTITPPSEFGLENEGASVSLPVSSLSLALRDEGRELLTQLRMGKPGRGELSGRYLFDSLGFAAEIAEVLSLTPQARCEGLVSAELLVPTACCPCCGGQGRTVSLMHSGSLSIAVCGECAGTAFPKMLSELRVAGHSLCEFFHAPVSKIAVMYPWSERLMRKANALCAAGAGAYTLDCRMDWLRADCD
ncbi:MAG: hypothetical protein PHC51_01590 [bacterium]|nr:hypothetical protein [bacterium]